MEVLTIVFCFEEIDGFVFELEEIGVGKSLNWDSIFDENGETIGWRVSEVCKTIHSVERGIWAVVYKNIVRRYPAWEFD